MEVIESYMRQKRINFDLQNRVKSYLKSLWKAGLGDKNSQEQEDRVISKLNDKLQKELLLEDKGKIFLDQRVFRDNFSKPFILKLIEKLKEIRLQPNEEVDNLTLQATNNFYYVHSGKVDFIFKKHVMNSTEKQNIQIKGVRHLEILNLWQGKCFGVQYLFGKHENCKFSIKSSDFTILYYLTPQDIEDVISSKEFRQSSDNENYCKLKDKLLLYGK